MAYTLITGASGGIGAEFAREFAKHGHDLVIVARKAERLEALKEELNATYKIDVRTFVADLSREEERLALFDFTESNGLTVDALINNAGFGDNNAYLDASWNRQKSMVDLNVVALMHLTHLYGSGMKERKCGKILNVASVAAFSAGPYMSVYYASKGFVLSFSEAIHDELKGCGVSVTALCLAPTATGFEKNAGLEKSKMFKLFGVESPGAVARRGYHGLMKNKAVVFHGKITYAFSLITRLTTRRFSRRLAKMMDT